MPHTPEHIEEPQVQGGPEVVDILKMPRTKERIDEWLKEGVIDETDSFSVDENEEIITG